MLCTRRCLLLRRYLTSCPHLRRYTTHVSRKAIAKHLRSEQLAEEIVQASWWRSTAYCLIKMPSAPTAPGAEFA